MFEYLESQLGNGEFLVGRSLSIADIGVGTQFVNLRHVGVTPDGKRFPKLAAYIKRLHDRPSFKSLIDEEAPAVAA